VVRPLDAGDRELRAAASDAYPVEIARVSKRFGTFLALDDCSLSVEPGEILALLGPSGCGKTTLLNTVAGFEHPDQGEVRLGGASISGLPPHLRGVGMVFQNYALFPHLTAFGNISYGLRVLNLGGAETERRVRDILGLMKLEGLAERYPHELSGGQRQRVAVARALVTRPRVLLMDEAFSALDRNLREAMQLELSLLLRRQGITTILVTHDQKEAFTVAARIAVMEAGRILQVGTAEELYKHPASAFVLDFLGASNRFQVIGIAAEGQSTRVDAESGISCRISKPMPLPADGICLHVRPEDMRLSERPTQVHNGPPATIELVTFQGSVRRVVLRLGTRQVLADVQEKAPFLGTGAKVFLDFDPAHAMVMRG
jgi:ABC-type Fe3+/spermidine/putrescine transport system ATPase subunit